MEYPEEIYETTINGGTLGEYEREWGIEGAGRRLAYNTGYAKGKVEAADPLAGYSNLTAAISAGEPIDWERLDGLKVQCVKPELGALIGKLDRDICNPIDDAHGWWNSGMGGIYIEAFDSAWRGDDGWTLWVEGEVPLARKTADQLEVGTYFLGELGGRSIDFMYVGRPIDTDKEKTIYYAPDMLKAITPASEWVVLEEYGPFQKPEDK